MQKKQKRKKSAMSSKKRMRSLIQQRAGLLTKATDEAKAERQRLLDEARKAADALSAKRQEALRTDAQNLNQAISRLAQKEVFAITRKALGDLATASLEERMGEVFDRRLRGMDGNTKTILGEALKKNTEPALVRSTFDLPAEQRAAIQNALNETFSADIHVRFETAPDLVSGIELTTNGQKIGWSIKDYLASLEKGVGELLKEKDTPEPKPEIKVEPKPEEPKPEVEPASKPEAQPVSTPEIKVETAPKPEMKTEPKTEDKSEITVEPKPANKVEPKSEEPASEIKSQ